ncbi:MAG TPA: hypothetical protein VID72_10350 [Ktedonobacterales bacterium]
MRAALGLALAAGGVVLALLVLHGRTPFDVSSSTSGASGGSAASTPSYPIQNPTAAQTIQHFGGLP